VTHEQRDDAPSVQGAEGVQNLLAVHESVVDRGVDRSGDPGFGATAEFPRQADEPAGRK
jgi:hypothetical protein